MRWYKGMSRRIWSYPKLVRGDHLRQPKMVRDHFWLSTIFGCRKWSPRTNYGCHKRSPPAITGPGRTIGGNNIIVTKRVSNPAIKECISNLGIAFCHKRSPPAITGPGRTIGGNKIIVTKRVRTIFGAV